VLLGAGWGIGLVVRSRRAARAEFARRSAREAVVDERLRIARELHDVLGHSMSLIAVRATVAGRLADQDPQHAKDALATIEQTSRSAMTEIRGLLDVLRPVEDAPGAAPRDPLPGSADLPALVDRFRSPGLAVELKLSGTTDLPAGADLAVFRVVQEALTNVVKHADARCCRISVHRRTDAVRVEVVDDGASRPAAEPPVGGLGLIGMRERVAAHGGTLTAGPLATGGFRVVAEIPRPERNTGP
jgi:signal transduction histidine kinase